MKSFVYTLGGIALAMLALNSCSGSSNGGGTSDADTIPVDSIVHTTQIELDILTASASYDISIDTLNYHLVISSNIQWPASMSGHNLKALQDTILGAAFANVSHEDVKHAIADYVNDVTSTGLTENGARVVKSDKVYPEGPTSFYVSLVSKVTDITSRLLTYKITDYSFLGGAHPNTMTEAFTYDLKRGKIVKLADLIQNTKNEDFAIIVLKQLADQLNMTPTALRDMFISTFAVSDNVYISNQQIVVEYNPYQLLPYSYGLIDVVISPYEISDILTSYGRDILID